MTESLGGYTILETAVPEEADTTSPFYIWGEEIERMSRLRRSGREKQSKNERHGGQRENAKDASRSGRGVCGKSMSMVDTL